MLYRTAFGSPNQSLRREIDRLFEDALGRGDTGRSWLPSVDVRETNDAIMLEFELPGIRPENVELTSENGVLTVRGEKREERKESDDEQGRYHVVERSYGAFSRSFQLPPGIDEESIEAAFENGVLMVRVPKAETPRTRRIEIGAARKGEVGGGARETQRIGERGRGGERGVERGSEGGAQREPMAASPAGGREESRTQSAGEGREGARSPQGSPSRHETRPSQAAAAGGTARPAQGGRGAAGARGEPRGEPRNESGGESRAATGRGSSGARSDGRGESRGGGKGSKSR